MNKEEFIKYLEKTYLKLYEVNGEYFGICNRKDITATFIYKYTFSSYYKNFEFSFYTFKMLLDGPNPTHFTDIFNITLEANDFLVEAVSFKELLEASEKYPIFEAIKNYFPILKEEIIELQKEKIADCRKIINMTKKIKFEKEGNVRNEA